MNVEEKHEARKGEWQSEGWGREKGCNEWSSQQGCTGVSYVSDSEWQY